MKKGFKTKSYFILAQILAIISGTFIVASGIFGNMSASSYSAIQTNIGLIYTSGNEDAIPYLLEANDILKDYALRSYWGAIGTFLLGMLGIAGSFIAWFKGHKSR